MSKIILPNGRHHTIVLPNGEDHLTAEQRAHFAHKLTPQQLEKEKATRKDLYPQGMPCIMCGLPWMAHLGTLCQTQKGGVIPCAGPNKTHILIKPVFDGTSLFVPDEDYYKDPDFDVA